MYRVVTSTAPSTSGAGATTVIVSETDSSERITYSPESAMTSASDHTKNEAAQVTVGQAKGSNSSKSGATSSSSATKHPSSPLPPPFKPLRPPTHYYMMTSSKENELRALYRRLDVNKDGVIDIKDLTEALREHVPHIPAEKAPRYARRIFQRATYEHDSKTIDFSEFVHYVLEHEKRLAILFRQVDRNKDGLIDLREITNYCAQLGITLSEQDAARIVRKMNTNGKATIDLEEFQKYLLFYPSANPYNVATFWKHNLVIDIGEDQALPEEFSPSELAGGVWWRHLVSGGLAGAVSRTCTAPLDRLKVYMQVHAGPRGLSIMGSLRYLLNEGGVKSMWRGNAVNSMKIAPESAIKFVVYEWAKRVIKGNSDSSDLHPLQRLLAGSTAGVVSQSCIYPLEVIKTRKALRTTGKLNRNLVHTALTLYRTEGVRTFYRGYVPNIIGIIPYAGIDLAVYETLKSFYLERYATGDEPGVLAVLGCGTVSSTSGMVCAYPLALVRTRLQAIPVPQKRTGAPAASHTMVGQFQHILRTEGFTGLYTGLLPNCMKVIPAVSISYLVYETMRKKLGATMT